MTADITAPATAEDPQSGDTAVSDPVLADVNVDANADAGPGAVGGTDDGDAANLSIAIQSITEGADADTVFSTGESGQVTVKATFDDHLDGSETHSFTLSAPAGFTIDGITGGDEIGRAHV